MASLITMNDRLGMKRYTVIVNQLIHRFQHKVHLQGVADNISKDLLREGIQYRRQIRKCPVVGEVCDIG